MPESGLPAAASVRGLVPDIPFRAVHDERSAGFEVRAGFYGAEREGLGVHVFCALYYWGKGKVLKAVSKRHNNVMPNRKVDQYVNMTHLFKNKYVYLFILNLNNLIAHL